MKSKSKKHRPTAPTEAAEAYALVEPAFMKLDPAELLPVSINVPRAVSVALGAHGRLETLRDRLSTLSPRAVQALDVLVPHALAAWYAHLAWLPPASGQDDVQRLLGEATALRGDMLVAAEALAHKKLLSPEAVAEIRSGLGSVDTANDLVALAALFDQGWDQIEKKTTVEWSDVERAAALGPELLIALGERSQPAYEPKGREAADRRQRAFTLFARTYDELRRSVTYLRWAEDDVEMFAPSLYAGRGRRARADASTDVTGADASPPSEAGTAIASPPPPAAQPGAPVGTPTPQPAAPAATAPPLRSQPAAVNGSNG